MTKQEFEKRFCHDADKTIEQLRSYGFEFIECDCGEDHCLGWKVAVDPESQKKIDEGKAKITEDIQKLDSMIATLTEADKTKLRSLASRIESATQPVRGHP